MAINSAPTGKKFAELSHGPAVNTGANFCPLFKKAVFCGHAIVRWRFGQFFDVCKIDSTQYLCAGPYYLQVDSIVSPSSVIVITGRGVVLVVIIPVVVIVVVVLLTGPVRLIVAVIVVDPVDVIVVPGSDDGSTGDFRSSSDTDRMSTVTPFCSLLIC
jgi:hypothetical protein